MIDLYDLIQNQAQFAATVALITSWLKARLSLNGNRTVLISFLVSGLIVLLALLSRAYPEIVNTLLVIVLGAVSAGGGVDLLKGVLKNGNS